MRKHDLENKIDNQKAHLSVIKGDIDNHVKMLSILNSKLSDVQELHENTLTNLAITERELEHKLPILTDFEKRLKEKKEALDLREKDLDHSVELRNERLRKEDLKLQNDIKVHRDELNALELNFERSRGILETDLIDLKERVLLTAKDELNAKETYEALLAQMVAQEKVYKYKESQIKKLDTELINLRSELEKQSKSKQIYIDGIEYRELELEKKEQNYQVLKARLKKVLSKLYPTQNIDNLI